MKKNILKATIDAFKILFSILFLVLKMIIYLCFHLILGKNSTAEKTKIPLAYSDYSHYFCIGLNLLFC